MHLQITDCALESIHERLGAVEPEQGGALFGPPGATMITSFLHDAPAQTTAVVYHNSSWLIDHIERRESDGEERFKGIIHSHPAGTPRPSAQDAREYAETLTLNPTMSLYLAPIVTHDLTAPLRSHELAYNGARYSFYAASLTGRGDANIAPIAPHVAPILSSLRVAGAVSPTAPVLTRSNREFFLAGSYLLPGIGQCTVLFPLDYPSGAPTIYDDDGNRSVPIAWDVRVPAEQRLRAAIAPSSQESPSVGVPRAATTSMSVDLVEPGTAFDSGALFARLSGLLSRSVASRRAMIVGGGSVGSYLAVVLARSGVGNITIVDPDIVEAHNIGRAEFETNDIGRPKTEAIARRISAISPACRVTTHHSRIEELAENLLRQEFQDADIVIGATDANATQLRVAQLAHWHGVPGIFPGLYKQARGGEIILSIPGGTCWDCCTAGLRSGIEFTEERPTDYGTGRLEAEPGLLADIHHVASATAKLALGFLDTEESSEVRRLASQATDGGLIYALFGMSPSYWIFADMLGSAAGQFAFQSIWASAESRETCTICGEHNARIDPYTLSTAPKSGSALEGLRVLARRVLNP